MPESVTFEEVREARRVVAHLAREELRDDAGGVHAAALVEAKRQLGIAISLRWPQRLVEVLEEQG